MPLSTNDNIGIPFVAINNSIASGRILSSRFLEGEIIVCRIAKRCTITEPGKKLVLLVEGQPITCSDEGNGWTIGEFGGIPGWD